MKSAAKLEVIFLTEISILTVVLVKLKSSEMLHLVDR
jgi:hypothetical protein